MLKHLNYFLIEKGILYLVNVVPGAKKKIIANVNKQMYHVRHPVIQEKVVKTC